MVHLIRDAYEHGFILHDETCILSLERLWRTCLMVRIVVLDQAILNHLETFLLLLCLLCQVVLEIVKTLYVTLHLRGVHLADGQVSHAGLLLSLRGLVQLSELTAGGLVNML